MGQPSSDGNIPTGVVFIITSASECSRAASSYVTFSPPLRRETPITDAAPMSPTTARIVFDVPPVPRISTFLSFISTPARRMSADAPA